MLGHVSIIVTADAYTSVLPDLARATAEAVASQILQAAGTHPAPASPRHRPPKRARVRWPRQAGRGSYCLVGEEPASSASRKIAAVRRPASSS
jgi:hypothetical protein